MTEKDLEEYELIVKEIDVLSKELTELKSDQIILKQDSTKGIYMGPIISRTLDDVAADIVGTEKRIQKMLRKLCSKRNDIEDYINSVESCEVRLILRLRYIEGMTYKEIAARIMVNGRSKDGLHDVTWSAISDKVKRHFKNKR